MLTLGTTTTLLWLAALPAAHAADPYECDSRYQPCGAPEQSGGGGGGGGGAVLVNNTDLGETYQSADDYDDDGVEDSFDNCPFVRNPEQLDDDGDSVGNTCDACPGVADPGQENLDGDELGDACDPDIDGDDMLNAVDLCVERPDPLQADEDGDLLGDACDPDMDDDGIPNLEDNCPLVANPEQSNEDPDRWGDACDNDDDGDGIRNTFDNCLVVANALQVDLDGDGLGDACDTDRDGDLVLDVSDNCPALLNPEQVDEDRDAVGDSCDDRYCFVVLGDHDNCLDPTDPFQVYVPTVEMDVGDTTRLRLFANHANQAIRYTWTVVGAPERSRATVEAAVGGVNLSTPYEYRYASDNVAQFTPDRPGTYQLRVVGELAFDDTITGQSKAVSEYTVELVANAAERTGCATVPMASWLLALPALGLAVRRRRRED